MVFSSLLWSIRRKRGGAERKAHIRQFFGESSLQ